MTLTYIIAWDNLGPCPSMQYTCGHCGSPLASEKGFSGELRISGRDKRSPGRAYIYICHFCGRPTSFDPETGQVPGVCYGNDVSGVDDVMVRDLYSEARRATSANCNTAAVLCCRKLLMHVAVAKGAEQNKSFKSYVEYLGEHYVPKYTAPEVGGG